MENVLLLIISASALCAADQLPKITYNFVYDMKTWSEAQSFCRATFTDMMIVDSPADVKILMDTVDSNKLLNLTNSSVAWIGMYNDLNSWSWSLEDANFYQPGEADYRNWNLGEPNFAQGKVQCVEMLSSGTWNDVPCEWSRKPICSSVTGTTQTFHFVNTSMSWPDAQAYCRTHFTDLASIRNPTENQNVMTTKILTEGVWFGLYRGAWRLNNGSLPTFKNWQDGQPNSHDEVCAVANFDHQGKWENWNCADARASVCYHIVRYSHKVVHLKLQRNSVNLNDPVVLEQLLTQLKQKLRGNGQKGLLNLSWRRKSDGLVFHEFKTPTGEEAE
ncbi:hypothetical protein OJAV_G00070460 [Oryzias javanicus]|uniref:C-type lectin domain-containing protein n=1 Tax=Oryzias javanicus TaxID=123683 RepID=A0A3S2PMY3_ORYJA|nr:hypothetical protein OJAV_G00070460 [Oryzias javanicus]